MSLRRTVATLTISVTLIAVVVAGALVVLTTVLHRTTAGATDSLESIRFAQDAQIELLMHPLAIDPVHVRDTESRIHLKLQQANRHITTPEEQEVLAHARERFDTYRAAYRDPSQATERALAYESAFSALDQLVDINVEQAKDAQQQASRWNSFANVIAVAATALLVLLAAVVLVWLKRRAFEPIFDLAATMERFGRGDHDARAAELGPLELREMCRRFNEMAAAIAAQRHAQTAFLGGVAHDLRTPLSALQMSVVLLLGDKTLTADEGLCRALERIHRQIKRMDRMLGDFLDGAKIEAGLLDLRVEVHDARAIVEQVVDLFEGMSSAHTIDVKLPAEPVSICCDQLRIEQVITNLISNAIKYSAAGSVVEVALRPRANELELAVTDQGVGIAQDSLSCLFEPFRRAGLSSESVPGVGLGLFVVRRIVEAHGGRIEVDSATGEGSTFRVLLPREFELPVRIRGSR